jgi:oligoribonuclease NrnB/cAMP/cGMP phosphodiesterase (DHH superfamily)
MITVIYHGDCLDGFGGAWAAWKKLGKKARYIPALSRDTLPKEAYGNEILYLIDYTYKASLLAELLKNNKQVTALDHHVTSEKQVRETTDFRYDIQKSGTTLAWEYFHPKEKTPRLLKHIEDGDIWRFSMSGTRDIYPIALMTPWTFPTFSKLVRDVEQTASRKKLVARGALLNAYRDTLIDMIIKNKEEVLFEGSKIFAVNAPIFQSQIGHLLSSDRPYAIVWNKGQDGIRVSLRSHGKIDVSAIAARYGGGGHKGAAGFEIKSGQPIPWKTI